MIVIIYSKTQNETSVFLRRVIITNLFIAQQSQAPLFSDETAYDGWKLSQPEVLLPPITDSAPT